MPTPSPNWAEQVTAISTAVGALGLIGVIGAAIVAAQQVREARKNRQAQMASDFLRRWNEDALVQTRRLVGQFKTPEELSVAFQAYVAANAEEAFVLYREPDYFEQLAALEQRGAFDFELVKLLLGQVLIDRWETWRPSFAALHGEGVYPLFEALVGKMRKALDSTGAGDRADNRTASAAGTVGTRV